MHITTRLSVLLSVLCVVLVGCDASSLGSATPAPIILVATPTPGGSASNASPVPTSGQTAPTAAINPTAQSSGGATPSTASTAPPTDATPSTASTSSPPGTQTITFAFDSFPSYFPGLIMETKGLLKQRGYELKLVPFALNGQNDVPEEERYNKLKSGEWDVLATTLDGFSRRADPAIGAVTTVIDESAGADKLVAKPEIATINDLKGKRVAFSQGSVGEYFLYYALSLAGLTPQDITLVPQPSVAEAVKAYTDGQADAVSAWEPDVEAAVQAGGKDLIASDKLRAILDVLITSRPALDGKTEAMQAFHDAWFDALRIMIDNPDEAEQAIISWGNSDWSTIAKPGDLHASLENLAQATLGANQIAFRTPQIIVGRMREAQTIWTNAGQAPPQIDLAPTVDGRFVLAAAQNQALISTQPPVNSSFLLTAQVNLPQLSSEQQQQAQAVVKLPLEKIDFEPDSVRLTEQAQNDLIAQVLPVLRSSQLYLRIEGSSAWPGPEGKYTDEDIRQFAEERATSVATFLTQQGISPNRLIIGTLASKFPQSTNDAELAQDRIVRFTLITPQGR